MKANPFTYGNPISEPSRFVGREREIEQVFGRLRNAEFESSSLVGDRRVGKTSLLNYLAHPDVRSAYGLHPGRYIFVYIDLQMVDPAMTPTRLWQRFLKQIAYHCQDQEVRNLLTETRESEEIDTFALADLFDDMRAQGQHVVLLLDEFEHVTENSNFDTGFFFGLRSLAIRRNLALITSSCRELIELCHSETIRSSPFFNIFANINVRPFSKTDAERLIATSLAGTGIAFTAPEIDVLFRLGGYHPYFLQAACHFLFAAYCENLNIEERNTFLLREYWEEAAPHLDDYWHNSNDHEKIVLAAMTLLERQDSARDKAFTLAQLRNTYTHAAQALSHLEKRGLVTLDTGEYSLFNASLGEWILNEITDAAGDEPSYVDWLASNQGIRERLTDAVEGEIGQVLPKIGSRYRELVINWASDPRNLLTVAGLLKSVLGLS